MVKHTRLIFVIKVSQKGIYGFPIFAFFIVNAYSKELIEVYFYNILFFKNKHERAYD